MAQKLRTFTKKHQLGYPLSIVSQFSRTPGGGVGALDRFISDLEKAAALEPPRFLIAGEISVPENGGSVSSSITRETNENMGSAEWLMGRLLPAVFLKHFGRSAGTNPTGPYAHFASECLTELDITNNGRPYQVTTIVTALQRVRKGRVRRKRSGSRSDKIARRK
jgi:hypothetical protein